MSSFTQYTLPNGMNVILSPKSTAPVVAVNVWVGVGSADETPEEAGLAHVHEHMLFKGTKRRGVGEVAMEVEGAGGYINAFTSFDQTCYYVVMSSRFMEKGIDILADVIQNSEFEADELGRELEVIQEEIKRGIDDPQRVATQCLFDVSYTKHPYKLPVIGTKESVDSFERKDVLNFFNKHYVPENMTLVLAGDFEIDDAKAMVEKHFIGKQVDYTPFVRPEEPEQKEARVSIETKDLSESHLRVGFHIPNILHEDIPALDILSVILGSGEVSTLHQKMVRNGKIATSAGAGAYTPKDAGIFLGVADYQLTADQTHEQVLHSLVDVFWEVGDNPIAPASISRAKNILESQEVFGRQTIEGIAMKLGRSFITTGDSNFEDHFYKAVLQTNEADLQRVAKKYFKPENCSVALVCNELRKPNETDLLDVVQRSFDGRKVSEIKDEVGIRRETFGDLTILVQEDHSVETFAIRAITMGGLRFENESNNGISSMLSDLLTQGNSVHDALEFATEAESRATSIHGISGRNTIGMGMSGLSKHLDFTRDMFVDSLKNASLIDEEIEHSKHLQLHGISARKDKIGAVNFDRFTDAFFGKHPYAMSSGGSEESVSAFDRKLINDFKTRIFNAPWVVSIVGDVNADEMITYFKNALSDFVGPEKSIKIEEGRVEGRSFHIGNLDREQAFVSVGFDAPIIGAGDQYAMEIVNSILSGQGGRLFMELRDKQSLAYSVYSNMLLGVERSAFMVNIGTSPEKVEQAVAGIVSELKRFANDVTDEEISRAKTYLAGTHDIGLQRNGTRSMAFALDELYGKDFDRTLRYADDIDAVSKDEIVKFAKDYFNFENVVFAITKPEAVEITEESLEKIFG